MNWLTIYDDDRLRHWKNLRIDIRDLPLISQLQKISAFAAEIPFGTRTLDYHDPMSWPTPWEILFHGSFCVNSISLLLFYTLILVEVDVNLELLLIEDDRGLFLLPLIDNQFVLNYESKEVSNISMIKSNAKILEKYSRNQIKTIV